MSKIYSNSKTGILTVSGLIKSIATDRLSAVLSSATYDKAAKKWQNVDYTVKTAIPFGEDTVANKFASAIGYQCGPNTLQANAFQCEKGYHEEQDLGFLTGEVVKAALNEEKNPDGSTKTNAKGAPRKRHFDIFVKTIAESGEEQLHIVKVYDGNPEYTPAGEKTPLEKAQARFKEFNDEGKSATVAVVTTPADSYSYERENNGETQVVTNYSHMGFKSLDVKFGEVRENFKAKEASAPTQAAPTQEAPAPAPVAEENKAPEVKEEAPAPAQTTPAQTAPVEAKENDTPETLADVDFTM